MQLTGVEACATRGTTRCSSPAEGHRPKEPLVTRLWMILIFFSRFSKFFMMLQKPFMIRNYVVIFFFLNVVLSTMCPEDWESQMWVGSLRNDVRAGASRGGETWRKGKIWIGSAGEEGWPRIKTRKACLGSFTERTLEMSLRGAWWLSPSLASS